MADEGRTPLRSLLVYTILTCAISWTWWTIWALVPDASSLVQTVLFVLGGLGPLTAALVLTAAGSTDESDRRTSDPNSGDPILGDPSSADLSAGERVHQWLSRRFRLRVRWRFYLVALGLPIVVVVVAGGVHALVFDGAFTPDALPATVEYPIFLGFVLLFGGGLEEPGWRGYLLPRLQRSLRPLTAALTIGLVWALWHAPLFLIEGTIQAQVSIPLYVLQLVSLSVILTWVTNAAGGSVVPAMVLHAGANAVLNYYPIGGPPARRRRWASVCSSPVSSSSRY